MPCSSRHHRCRVGCRGLREALLEIPDQIVHGFGPDRQSNRARAHTCSPQLVVVQLTMGCAGGMNDQALRITNVRKVRPEADTANEVLAGGAAATAVEREHGTRA